MLLAERVRELNGEDAPPRSSVPRGARRGGPRRRSQWRPASLPAEPDEIRRWRADGPGLAPNRPGHEGPDSTLRRYWKACQKSRTALRHGEPCLAGVSAGAEGSEGWSGAWICPRIWPWSRAWTRPWAEGRWEDAEGGATG
jgi:hypothetical protein